MAWADSRREQGYRDRLIWFTPEAVAALDKLQADNGGKSLADVVSAAVVQSASAGLAFTSPDVAHDVLAELEDIKSRLAKLEAAQAADLSVPVATLPTAGDVAGGGDRISKGSAAHITLIGLIADRIAGEGEGFSRADLHRDIVAAGHKVHGHPRNFATFVKANLAEARACLAQRQAAA